MNSLQNTFRFANRILSSNKGLTTEKHGNKNSNDVTKVRVCWQQKLDKQIQPRWARPNIKYQTLARLGAKQIAELFSE